jgi:hypothetical protein
VTRSGAGRRVFLSHTSELRAHPASPRSFIDAAEDAVQRSGDVAVDMAFFTADPRPTADKCREAVGGCDVYVLIAGFRYGSPVRDQPDVCYTELEFDTAVAAGLLRLVFLLGDDAVGPRALLADQEHGARQQAFRQRVNDAGVTTATFTTPDQLETLVYQALQELHASDGHSSRPPEPSTTTGTAWNVPAQTVEVTGRDDLLAALAGTLRQGGRAVAHAALHGIGGIGKTTAATEYAHQHSGDYDIAWWVPAQDPTLIPDALAGLA